MKKLRFVSVFLLCFSGGLSAAIAGDNNRPAPAQLHPALAAPPVVVAQPPMETMAYMLAWRNANEATHHADAVHLSQTLAELIGLPKGAAFDALERYFDKELAANPGRFDTFGKPVETVHQLLRENVGQFQRILSPALSDDAYARYQQLLDSLKIEAR